MADSEGEDRGDREIDEKKQKLTTIAVDVVAWPESFCGGRNRRRRAAAPASSRGSWRRLQARLGRHLLQIEVVVDAAHGGHALRVQLRRWPRVLATASGGALG